MRHAAQSQLPTTQVPVRTSMQVSVHVGHKRIGAVAPGATGTAGYSEHPDYTIHSFVIKCIHILTLSSFRVRRLHEPWSD